MYLKCILSNRFLNVSTMSARQNFLSATCRADKSALTVAGVCEPVCTHCQIGRLSDDIFLCVGRHVDPTLSPTNQPVWTAC